MARGVNTRDSRRRWRVWVGGSSKMMDPGGRSTSALMISSSVPCEEMYVSHCFEQASMSSKRLSA